LCIGSLTTVWMHRN